MENHLTANTRSAVRAETAFKGPYGMSAVE
jgi:hypothetical protein